MSLPLIPAEVLAKTDKILFITHLALGDFTYLQNDFRAFAAAYPHIEVHLWVDEVRRTTNAAKWDSLKKYSLYDWVEACPFFGKIYKRTYSPALLEESIREAQNEHYPVVVSLATLRPHLYASMARRISPQGLVVGMVKKVKFFQPHHAFAYRKLDATIPPYTVDHNNPQHISDVYADWFRQLCGLDIPPAERMPFVHIPAEWNRYATEQIAQWGTQEKKRVFINPYAKTKKRCWPLERVGELIVAMRELPDWRNACFIVNAMPPELPAVKTLIAEQHLDETVAFSATNNFFQLPAVLARCDLIVSVETAVMHLANAVHVPVIALMRQKNPEWIPVDHANSIVITAEHRRDWVDAIPAGRVIDAMKTL
ncbi:MAG TPA: glycosyltransferase family 9 protein [Rhodocyclaceae bacterium]|nr:glycosyltransferase family 9 protein [Rhodocyclaceae bacterium]